MKHKTIACAAIGAALFAGAASAVSLNPRGLGQVLIYPYYTVNKGQDTLISIVNVGDVGKAVKVAVKEGYNGRAVLDFIVLLSPHDVWVAGIAEKVRGDAVSGGVLTSQDNSCVYPAIAGDESFHETGFSFRPYAYSNEYGGYPPDGGPTGVSRTREGFIEIIAVGDIVPGSETDRVVKHVQTGTPGEGTPICTQASLQQMENDLVVATNTLAGSAGIVNAAEGTFYSYNADALSDFSRVVLLSPTSVITPSLPQANSFPAMDTEAVVLVDGKPLTLHYENGIDAVSAVLMADAIYGEFLADPSMGATTDWIVTLPTKQFYTDPMYIVGQHAIRPFESIFNQDGDATSFVGAHISQFDREEGVWEDQIGNPPSTPPTGFWYQVNAISFPPTAEVSDASRTFGSVFWSTSDIRFPTDVNGWMKIDLSMNTTHTLPPDRSGIVLKGLPVTGFMAFNIVNAQAQPGKLANYNGLFPHRASTACESTQPPQGTQDPCS